MARKSFPRHGPTPGQFIAARADEAKRRHPELTYTQILREMGFTQRDPTRALRKLRSGETPGTREFQRGIAPPPGGREHDLFTVIAEKDGKYVRVNVLAPKSSAFDVFRLRDSAKVQDAVERHFIDRYGNPTYDQLKIEHIFRPVMQTKTPIVLRGQYLS